MSRVGCVGTCAVWDQFQRGIRNYSSSCPRRLNGQQTITTYLHTPPSHALTSVCACTPPPIHPSPRHSPGWQPPPPIPHPSTPIPGGQRNVLVSTLRKYFADCCVGTPVAEKRATLLPVPVPDARGSRGGTRGIVPMSAPRASGRRGRVSVRLARPTRTTGGRWSPERAKSAD